MILEPLHASVRAAGPISSRSNYQGFHGSNKADLFYDQTVISEVSQNRSQVVLFHVQSRVDPFMTVILELEVGCLTSWSNCNFSNRAGPTLSFSWWIIVLFQVKTTTTGLTSLWLVHVSSEIWESFMLALISEIKQGQACTGAGHSTMCVAGAECTSGTCTCKASVYTANSGNGKCGEYKITYELMEYRLHSVQPRLL